MEEAEQKHYKENIPAYTILAEDEEDPSWAGDWVRRSHKRNFNPLPLPAHGGSLGGLMQLLPPAGPDVQLLRCVVNLTVNLKLFDHSQEGKGKMIHFNERELLRILTRRPGLCLQSNYLTC